MTRLVTERLVLETLTLDEVSALRRGDRHGRTWAEDYPAEPDLVVADVVAEAGEHYDESEPLGPLQIRRRANSEAIGGIGFLSAPDAAGIVEVGYGLVPSARGVGFATEALRALCAWVGEQGVTAVEAMTAPDNVASHRVLMRVGFRYDRMIDGGSDGTLQRWVLHVQ